MLQDRHICAAVLLNGSCLFGKHVFVSQGLAFPNISTAGVVPPFFNMVERGLLQQNLFSLWLNPNQTSVAAGELVFGGINAANFTGALTTIPLYRAGCAPPSEAV